MAIVEKKVKGQTYYLVMSKEWRVLAVKESEKQAKDLQKKIQENPNKSHLV